jgi:curli biogenesis system outer membrane secretion channel CsgG
MRAMLFSAGLCLVACGGSPQVPNAKLAAPSAQTASYSGPKMRVAVGTFSELEASQALMKSMGWPGVGPMISEQAVNALVQTGRVAVLERSQIRTAIGNTQTEKESDISKYFDQDTTVDSGKLLGAQAMLVGVVTEFEPDVSGGDAGLSIGDLVGLTYHQDKAIVGIEVRLVDQQTGKVLAAANGRGEVLSAGAGAKGKYKGVQFGASGWSRTPLGTATRQATDDALKKLVTDVAEIRWQGNVVSVSGSKVFIDAGHDLSLRKGHRFQVAHRGDAIKGPDGSVLGYDETDGGTMILNSVQDKMSIGAYTGETPVKVGDVVRYAPLLPGS